ncbi:exported hypothetical protein [Candidatus Terasakiella magnetica]|nr:exported hypothetical protein [Candidatus Terasakiella magnetica]
MKYGFQAVTLFAAVLLVLAGCTATSQTEKVGASTLCDEAGCRRITPQDTVRSLEKIKTLLKDGLTRDFRICEARQGDQACDGDDIGIFVLGGPIPGRGAMKGASILAISESDASPSLKINVHLNLTFLGVPLYCSTGEGVISADPQGRIAIEVAPHFCNWALVGNLFTTLSFAIDRVDLTTRSVTGYWSIAVAGVGNGSGSGYALFKVPDSRLSQTVIAELATIAKPEAQQVDVSPAAKPVSADTGKKVALVMGNAAYKRLPLENTINDANVVADALTRVGFSVTKVMNGDFDAMKLGLKEFYLDAKSSDLAVIYYAGHGVEVNGRNYLVATDVDISSPEDVLSRSVDVTRMLATLGLVTANPKILILDACRDNPFPDKYKRQQRGLAQIEAPVETFIAFSTSPGNVSEDGSGKNSPYTRSLAAKLGQPNLSLEAVFRGVRKDVISDTDGRQTPWENTSLTSEVRFSKVN